MPCCHQFKFITFDDKIIYIFIYTFDFKRIQIDFKRQKTNVNTLKNLNTLCQQYLKVQGAAQETPVFL